MEKTPSPPRLGDLLREKQLISERDLAEALRIHRETGKQLGRVLVDDLGLVSIAALRDLLAVQKRWRPLGELLVERALLGEEHLADALAEQERTGRPLGEIVRERFHVSSAALDAVLREQRELELELERGYASGLRAALAEGRSAGPAPAATERGSVGELRLGDRLRAAAASGDAHMHVALKAVEGNEKKIASLASVVAKQREELDHLRDVLLDRQLTIIELEQRVAELEGREPGVPPVGEAA